MPSRILRDGILTSVPVNMLSTEAENFYRRLHSVVDDYGRSYSNPALLRAACYPLQLAKVKEEDIVAWLIEATKLKLVLVYCSEGKDCLQVENFKQQTKTRPKFPAPPQLVTEPLTDGARKINGSVHESVHLVGGEGVVGVVSEVGVVLPAIAGSGNLPVSPAACPHGEIIKLYAKHLPMGRQVRPPWNGTRSVHLQARWREMKARQSLDWWDKFFAHCAASTFLTGRSAPRPGRKPFEVALDWIVDPGNFQKIIEGAYDD